MRDGRMQTAVRDRATQEDRTREAKRRLRETALLVFADGGYEAATLGSISLKAGFSRTLAQYHYPDKKTLALELLRDRIVRDNHIQLVESSPHDTAEQAWAALFTHLNTLKDYYIEMHAGKKLNPRANGEMAIHAAAFISKDDDFRACVEEQARDQVQRIGQIFETCRRGGWIAKTTNTHALAILYVQSIWSLAQALYTSPFARKSIGDAFDQLSLLLNGLKRDTRGAS